MTLVLALQEQLRQAPGYVAVRLTGGVADDPVDFYITGTTPAIYSTVLNGSGNVSTDLPISTRAAGTYTLTATTTSSGSATDVLTVAKEPVDNTPDPDPTNPTPPIHTVTNYWQLYDPLTTDLYTFPRNPQSWTGPPERTVYYNHDATTAIDGNVVTWQEASRAWPFEFTGWIQSSEEYHDLNDWALKRRRFWLIDHRDVSWLVTFLQFDARALIKLNLLWAHTYTMKVLVFNKPNGGPFDPGYGD